MHERQVEGAAAGTQVAAGRDVVQAVDHHVHPQRFVVRPAEVGRKHPGHSAGVDGRGPLGRDLGLAAAQGGLHGQQLAVYVGGREGVRVEQVQPAHAKPHQFLDQVAAQAAAADHRHPAAAEGLLLGRAQEAQVALKPDRNIGHDHSGRTMRTNSTQKPPTHGRAGYRRRPALSTPPATGARQR